MHFLSELLGQMSSRTAVRTVYGALGDMQISQRLRSKTVWRSCNFSTIYTYSVLTMTGHPSVKAEIKLTVNTLSVMSYTATRLTCLYGKCENSDHRGSVVHYRQGKEGVLSSEVLRPVLSPIRVVLKGYRGTKQTTHLQLQSKGRMTGVHLPTPHAIIAGFLITHKHNFSIKSKDKVHPRTGHAGPEGK